MFSFLVLFVIFAISGRGKVEQGLNGNSPFLVRVKIINCQMTLEMQISEQWKFQETPIFRSFQGWHFSSKHLLEMVIFLWHLSKTELQMSHTNLFLVFWSRHVLWHLGISKGFNNNRSVLLTKMWSILPWPPVSWKYNIYV